MKRREFIAALGGAAAWPIVARAQQSPKSYRIGALLLNGADVQILRTEMREALGKAGYLEGQNITFDFRSADGKIDLLPKLAAELVALKVNVIVAIYTPCALAAQQATRDIPIVVLAGDPVGTGLVSTLAHPGGNITGVSLMAAELQVRRAITRHASIRSPHRIFGQRRRSVMERDSGASPACG
jgi:putative ABC transport system substrate-binding protein